MSQYCGSTSCFPRSISPSRCDSHGDGGVESVDRPLEARACRRVVSRSFRESLSVIFCRTVSSGLKGQGST
jgi:hypothetical protein